MKKYFILPFVLMLISFSINAQIPQAFNYQAVARDAAGNILANQLVSLRFTILSGGPSGTVEYVETQMANTNEFGLFTLEIGQGTIVFGTFSTIDWSSGDFWLKTELDASGGTSYANMGTAQLLSVPFAMYAANSGVGGPTGPTGADGPTGAAGARCLGARGWRCQ